MPPSKQRRISTKAAKEDEQSAKAQLWKALATQLTQGNSPTISQNQSNGNAKQSALEDKAHVFGRTVADSLLQCETKDWPLLKKKIMDLFFEYEQQKSNDSRYYPMPAPIFQQQQHQPQHLPQHFYSDMIRNIPTPPALHRQQTFSSATKSTKRVDFSPDNSSTWSNDS